MKNFLFLSIDDLNDWTSGLGGYSGTVLTPNLDKLMGEGTTFTNAFAQAAICNPSRASVLTGKEPQETGIFNNLQYNWEAEVPAEETLFGVFNATGYNSQGVGKLFHTGASDAANSVMFDNYRYMGKDQTGVNLDGKPVGPYTGTATLADERRADYVADFLENYVPDPANPLLMSVGLLKPHTDWVVPQEYFDLYPIEDIQIDATANDISDIPQYVLDIVRQQSPWGHGEVPDEATWKLLIQAYLATISFMDAQVGKIIDALDNSAIAGNTALVLWSDHGYHLGDKDTWHKFTLWDNAARAPLIIRDPGTVPAGLTVSDPVELLDIFPTMLEMAGIPSGNLQLSGKSLVPYFNGETPAGEAQAFTWMYGNVSIRTNDYRFSLYEDGSVELYNVANDPELLTNLAGDPAHAAAEAQLRATLISKFNLVGYGEAGNLLQGSDGNDVLADASGVVLQGGDGDDTYFITQGSTVIERQGGGRDLIVVQATDYRLPAFVENLEVRGFSGIVYGNNGNNVITANARQIYGLDGDDTIMAASRSGYYDLGSGNDEIFGGGGNDTIVGGLGNDLIRGNNDDDSLMGNEGADTILGGSGKDTLEGGDGDDLLKGDVQDDLLFGGSGNDSMLGGSGEDTLLGDSGFDLLEGGAGDDLLDGGDQADNLLGGVGNDTIRGGNGFDRLFGGDGNDLGYGGSGTDALFGQLGNDTLYGEAGNDRLYGEAGFDWLEGGAGDDLLDGGDQADNLLGGVGNDTIRGGNGFDRLFGGDGNDLGYGGSGTDALFGQLGNDTLYGEAGNDRLYGGQGNDILDGGADDDWITGGSGFDTLIGATGNDTLTGDFNADTFVFSDSGGGFGQDTITDFDANNDLEKINLSRVGGIADFNDLVANHMNQIGANVVIDDGSGNTITLQNVQLNDLLDGNDFLF